MKNKLNLIVLSLLIITVLTSCSKIQEEGNESKISIYSPSIENLQDILNPVEKQVDIMLKDVNYAISRGLIGVQQNNTEGKAIKDKLIYNTYTIKGERVLQSTSFLDTTSYNIRIQKGKKIDIIVYSKSTDMNGNSVFTGTFNGIVYKDENSLPEEYFSLMNTVKNAFSDPNVNQDNFTKYKNSKYIFNNVSSAYSVINGTGSRVFSVKDEIYNTVYNIHLSDEEGEINIELEFTEDKNGNIEPLSLIIDSEVYNPYEVKTIIENNLRNS